jgi:predicted DNA-binding antitoxin AbrB/MazE fold protein
MFSSVASVEADYENGVLRPVRPLRLRPGERVHLIVRRQSVSARWDLSRLATVGEDEDRALATAGLEDWAGSLKGEDVR